MVKSSELFTCILLDYVAHEIIKDFLKNSCFENMTAGNRSNSTHCPKLNMIEEVSDNEGKFHSF